MSGVTLSPLAVCSCVDANANEKMCTKCGLRRRRDRRFVVGFTGTRLGMTMEQELGVAALLGHLLPEEVHHGDCLGADADFDRLCRGIDKIKTIVVHPGFDSHCSSPARAFCHGPKHRVLLSEPYMVRNHHIVESCDLLIATPKEAGWRSRGGTWATIGLRPRDYVIVWPDGSESRG
jgi:hypothetical protein